MGLRKRSRAVLVFVGFLCVLGIAASFGQAPATRVLTPGESVQAAIDAAEAGEVLVLSPGSYVENLVVEKDLVLRGGGDEPTSVQIGGRSGPVLLARGRACVSIENLTVASGQVFAEGYGLLVEGAAQVTMARVVARDNSWCGIRVRGESQLTAVDCEIVENRTAGLQVEDFATVRLDRCRIERNASHGVFALHASNLFIQNSTIADQVCGLWLWDGSRTRIESCEIRGHELMGAACWNAAVLWLEASRVEGNAGSGVVFSESSRGILGGSEFYHNGDDGVLIKESAIVEVSDCTISGNGKAGVRMAVPSCTAGEYDWGHAFKGRVTGTGNVVPGPGEPQGNGVVGLCPMYPGGSGAPWPEGFLAQPKP